MTSRRVVEDTPATPHFDFLYGQYRLSSWIIPYFSTTMSLPHVASSLHLTADLPGSDIVRWRLDELYQREVDWPRVERRIVPYLRATQQPQFFNALSIALLPKGRSLSQTQHAFGDERAWHPPALADTDRFEKIVTIGPISCGYWTEWDTLDQSAARTGQMRWNPEEVFAVALDGQHRLAAIQQFIEHPGVPEAQLRATSVPVIFITLDPRFGYQAAVPKSLVDVLRIVFIDLNKHAKVPTRARQILLDDKDPTSVCVRALVGDTVSGNTGELSESPPRLPLALVDWHTEQAKFDEGPYLTTILTLDWAVTALLGASPVQNFMDYTAIRKQVQALSQSLQIDMRPALERLRNLEALEFQPFSYSESSDANELEHMKTAFQEIWNPVFICLLTEFAPYRDLMALREQHGSFTLDFSNWYRLYHQQKKDLYAGRATREYREFLGRLRSASVPVGETALNAIRHDIEAYKNNSFAYNVVFQRAYFLAYREWTMVDDTHLDDLEGSDAVDVFDDDGEDADYHDGDGVDADESDSQACETVDEAMDPPAHAAEAARLSKRAEEFVTCLNTLVERKPEILEPSCLFERDDQHPREFWLGTLVKAEGGIDFTQSASLRAKDVIFWAVAMQMYHIRVGPGERSDFDEFWADILDADATSFLRRIRRSVTRFAKEGSSGARILKARGEDFDIDDSTEEARGRMSWLWVALGL